MNEQGEKTVTAKAVRKSSREKSVNVSEVLEKLYLNEVEVSGITGLTLSALRNARHLRRGIPYYKISERLVRYKTIDVIAFMEKRRIDFQKVA